MTETPYYTMNASTYHKLTSYNRFGMTPHRMDWAHAPALHKTYPHMPSVALRQAETFPDISLTGVLEGSCLSRKQPVLDLKNLSTILSLAYGVTAERQHGTQTFFYRSAPSAGALYPCEVYTAAGNVDGLEAGLYNYSVEDSALVRIRQGTGPGQIDDALTAHVGGCPAAVFMITGIFFRSAWKYRDRAFRYLLLDAGHLIENLVLALSAYGYSCSVHYDFDDSTIAHVLGIDAEREVCLGCVRLYDPEGVKQRSSTLPRNEGSDVPKTLAASSRVSAAEVFYPPIQEICDSSQTVIPDKSHDGGADPVFANLPQEQFPVLRSGFSGEASGFVESVLQRRSRRNFVPYPMQTGHMMQLMEALCMTRDGVADEGESYARCMTTGFGVVNIEGFDPGVYLLEKAEWKYGWIPNNHFSGEQAAGVCLGQEWLKNSAVHFMFMANLADIDRIHGSRGYRYAMLNAGRAGQRIYLTATAQGNGACGIGALYDDEAGKMLGLNNDSFLLYLLAVGRNKRAIYQ